MPQMEFTMPNGEPVTKSIEVSDGVQMFKCPGCMQEVPASELKFSLFGECQKCENDRLHDCFSA